MGYEGESSTKKVEYKEPISFVEAVKESNNIETKGNEKTQQQ